MESTGRKDSCFYHCSTNSRSSWQTKSLSASHIFPHFQAPIHLHLRRPQHSDSQYVGDELLTNDCPRSTPRISISDTESGSQISLVNQNWKRPYLRYQPRCLLSTDSDMGLERKVGDSFSFSDLDTVREDMEN